jgi:hypothetical protein
MNWLWYLTGALITSVAALLLWRGSDKRAEQRAWRHLTELASAPQAVYTPALVKDLPEPARRYFNYTIRPGALLKTVIELHMTGELGLGTRDAPNYRPMRAQQILAPPFGLVWRLWAGPISGSDGTTPEASWTRFWLFSLLPLVRVGGADHHRSAFGRVIAEGAFWAPASLLPGEHISWEPLGEDSARAVVVFNGLRQSVDITVAPSGEPTRVLIQRWSNENPGKVFRTQPFGGYLSQFREFEGYRLPTRVEGGNHLGTPLYFPFYKAHVTTIRFPAPPAPERTDSPIQ